MSNQDFNLTSIKSTSRVRSITSDKFCKSKYDKTKFTKVKVLNGVRMMVRVEMCDDTPKIVGGTQMIRIRGCKWSMASTIDIIF